MEQRRTSAGTARETPRDLRARILELEEKNRVLDAFIENSTDAIQISDRNLVTLRINRAYEVLPAPVKACPSCPKSSLSKRDSVMAPQLMGTNRRSDLPLF